MPALGTGFCADENSEERFEYRPCLYAGEYIGLPPCPPNLVRTRLGWAAALLDRVNLPGLVLCCIEANFCK